QCTASRTALLSHGPLLNRILRALNGAEVNTCWPNAIYTYSVFSFSAICYSRLFIPWWRTLCLGFVLLFLLLLFSRRHCQDRISNLQITGQKVRTPPAALLP